MSEGGGGPSEALVGRLGRFRLGQLASAGLLEVGEKLVEGREISPDDVARLLRARLPHLGKLVELVRSRDGGDSGPRFEIVRPGDGAQGADGVVSGRVLPVEALVESLLELRRQLAVGDRLTAWQPEIDGTLDGPVIDMGGALGLDVLRAIALARLILPGEVEIRAPVAMLGMKVAQAALEFGADHLGAVAADEETARASGLPLLAEVTAELEQSRPTEAGTWTEMRQQPEAEEAECGR